MNYGKSFVFVSQEFAAIINQIFILGGGLGTRPSFCEV